LVDLQVSDTVALFITEKGELQYVVNGVGYGVACKVPTDVPLFVVVNVCGRAKQVSIVDAPLLSSKFNIYSIGMLPYISSKKW